LTSIVTTERANIAGGGGLIANMQPIFVAAEPGIYRSWSVSAQHARAVTLRPGLVVTLAGDSNSVLFASGQPSAGTGSNGDISVDWAENTYYTKAAGVWSSTGVVWSPSANLTSLQVSTAQSMLSGAGMLSGWKNEALVKLIANSPSFNNSSGLSTLDYCSSMKQEMEANYLAVRFLRVNRGTSVLTGDKVVCFTTETMAFDTSANMAFPKIAGTVYANLAGATDQLGFRNVTWAGSATIPSISAAITAPSLSLSDWTYIKPTARAGGEPSTRPILGWRIEHLGSTNGNWAFSTMSANVYSPLASMRYRTIVGSKYATSGAIADLSTAKTFSTDTTTQDIFPIVRFTVPVFSVWGVGDSITACTDITTDQQAAWGFKACADLSTPLKPVVWANLGVSDVASSDFWVNLKTYLAGGVPPPSMLVVNVGSINEYGSIPNVREAEIVQYVASDAVAVCRQYQIPFLCLWGTMVNENIATALLDAVRVQANTDVYVYAQAVKCFWLDTSGMGDGASPEKWIPGYKFDAIHPNESAQDTFLVPRLTAIIKAAAGL
jgi:hypothetical protein